MIWSVTWLTNTYHGSRKREGWVVQGWVERSRWQVFSRKRNIKSLLINHMEFNFKLIILTGYSFATSCLVEGSRRHLTTHETSSSMPQSLGTLSAICWVLCSIYLNNSWCWRTFPSSLLRTLHNRGRNIVTSHLASPSTSERGEAWQRQRQEKLGSRLTFPEGWHHRSHRADLRLSPRVSVDAGRETKRPWCNKQL